MITLTIDEKKIQAPAGTTVLAAAGNLGIEIPALCLLEGYAHHTSCMVCVVQDKNRQKLIPSCAAPVEEGMDIQTQTPEVIGARRAVLELLLSEHAGDCQAPCRRACPVGLNIPLMLRQISLARYDEALSTLEQVPLAPLLCALCPATCEKNCRRKEYDAPVAVRTLALAAGAGDTQKLYLPPRKPATGKRIAVIGSGPAGLGAAFYLLQEGNGVSIMEKAGEPCPTLVSNSRPGLEASAIVERERRRLETLGADFQFGLELGRNLHLDRLQAEFDAVIMAVGFKDAPYWTGLGLAATEKGIAASIHDFGTGRDGIFACGSALHKHKSAANSAAQGRACALAVDSFLRTGCSGQKPAHFDSRLGKLHPGEIKELLKESLAIPRLKDRDLKNLRLGAKKAGQEARRCLHCDCRRSGDCALRRYAARYQASALHYKGEERARVQKYIDRTGVIYEPAKCIKCGRCVRITRAKKEELGLAFIGRGFQVKVGVPFNASLDRALTHTKEECVAACPTGALAFFT